MFLKESRHVRNAQHAGLTLFDGKDKKCNVFVVNEIHSFLS